MAVETEIETYRGVVYPWQLDHMDHMNVQFFHGICWLSLFNINN
jgi:hypothetical protein